MMNTRKKSFIIALALFFLLFALLTLYPGTAYCSSGQTLYYPYQNAYVNNSSITFTWSKDLYYEQYHLQVSNSSDFSESSIFYESSSIFPVYLVDPVSHQVSGFPSDGSTYYWRVKGKLLNTWQGWSDAISFINGPPPPQRPLLFEPGSNFNVPSTSINFSWREVSGATVYRLQVWPYGSASGSFIDDDTITFSGGDTIYASKTGFPNDSTCFWWRVKAYGEGGWGEWSVEKIFSNGLPEQPLILSPYYFQNIDSDAVTLEWTEGSGFIKYHLQVSTDYSFTGDLLVDRDFLSSNSYNLSDLPNDETLYYWRVRAISSARTYSQWSGVSAFVNGPLPDSAPQAPDLCTPEQGSFENSFSVNFSWEASTSTNLYHLQISSAANFMDPAVNEHLSGTSVTKLLPKTGYTYYWRVRAYNSRGWSNWSDVRSFINGPSPPPAAPVMIEPVDGAIIEGGSINFKWSEPDHAALYRLQVWSTMTLAGSFYDADNITTGEQAISGFPDDGTAFHWRVQAYSDGGWGGWSGVANFYSGTAVDSGSLKVIIEPHGARRAGAQWRLADGPDQGWNDSGATIDDLPADRYTVEFSAVEGWEEPASLEVAIRKELLTEITGNYSTPEYFVRISVNPAGGGTVEGAGEDYPSGQRVTVTATANPGYHFVNWTERGIVVSDKDSYSFRIDANRQLSANFLAVDQGPEPLYVTLTAKPEIGGVVIGEGYYLQGERVIVLAEANPGYSFINWTDLSGEKVLSSKTRYQFYLGHSNLGLVANFQPVFYPEFCSIDLLVNPDKSGRVSGGGVYEAGETVTVEAVANKGYTFVNWTDKGNVVSTGESYSFVAETNCTLVANFTDVPPTFSVNLTTEPPEGGSVSGGGYYLAGEQVFLTARAKPGYGFVMWVENNETVSTSESYDFKMGAADRSLVAYFQTENPAAHSVTVLTSPEKAGTVDGGGNYEAGSAVKVAATANRGFSFVAWTDKGKIVSREPIYEFKMGSADRVLVANFQETTPAVYSVTVKASPENGGAVKGGGSFEKGDTVMVSAQANEGFSFVNWTGDGKVLSSSENYSFRMGTTDRNLTANFETATAEAYRVALNANPPEGGLLSGAGYYEAGASVTINAFASEGYSFVNWTENGTVVSTRERYRFTMGDKNRELLANFDSVVPIFKVAVAAEPADGGSVSGEGSYQEGSSVMVSAKAGIGYSFAFWSEGGQVVSKSADYKFTMGAGDRKLVAHFLQVAPTTHSVFLSANPAEGGRLSGAGEYEPGEIVLVTAQAASGYSFVNWTEGGTVVSEDESYKFEMGSVDRKFVANFKPVEPETYRVFLSASPAHGGNVKGSGYYSENTEVTVVAKAAEGYSFVYWGENGTVLSKDESYTFILGQADRNLVAYFQPVQDDQ